MSEFLSSAYKNMRPYTPGEQPQGGSFIKLNTNESPFMPSPKVIDALNRENIERLKLYPDPGAGVATSDIAGYYGIKPHNVLLGNGSDEILAFCFMAYCAAGAYASFTDITYGFYKVFAGLVGAKPHVMPLNDDFTIDIEAGIRAPGSLFLANPNAPTGLALNENEIEHIVKSRAGKITVIDEAYVDFGAKSAAPLIEKYKTLIVVQTMSKSRNLAGARIGFALCDKALIEDIAMMKFSFNPYSINRLSLLAASAAIKDDEYFKTCVSAIINARAFTADGLKELGFDVIKSSANFIFAKPKRVGGLEYYTRLKEKGILVRHFDTPRLRDYVRITIGSHDEMEKLLATTKEIWREI